MMRLWSLMFLAVLSAVALAGCVGIAGFSPIPGGRVAIIDTESTLFTTDSSGGSVQRIGKVLGYSITFNRTGTMVLYAMQMEDVPQLQVCIARASGPPSPTCPIIEEQNQFVGVLTFLPDGDFLLAFQDENEWLMRFFDTSGNQISSRTLDQFFLTENSYEVKRGANGFQWFMKPYDQSVLRWLGIDGSNAVLFTASASGVGQEVLPRSITTLVLDELRNRDQADITSGVISADGTKMAFRTKTGTDPNFSYSLWVLDLARPDGDIVSLVTDADFRIGFSFSPEGREIVYESNAGGRSVWLANADGSSPRSLADDASLPEWHRN